MPPTAAHAAQVTAWLDTHGLPSVLTSPEAVRAVGDEIVDELGRRQQGLVAFLVASCPPDAGSAPRTLALAALRDRVLRPALEALDATVADQSGAQRHLVGVG